MLDHVGLQVQDVEASLEFYLRAFGTTPCSCATSTGTTSKPCTMA